MKILLTNHMPLQGSGSGAYVKNIAKSLQRKGHEVCIITPENTIETIKLEGIKLHPVYFKYKEKIKGQQDFNFGCFEAHPRSNLQFGKMTDLELQKYEEAFRQAIETEIREFKPDIIHAQHLWIISKIALEYSIPVVVTCHGSDIMGYEAWPKFHNMMYEVANKCKRIVAISNDSKSVISNIFKENKEKVITIPNGFDDKTFYKVNYDKKEILKSLNINKNYDKIVCFAGRITKNKGIDLLLRSAKIYEKENILTLIVGGGEEFENLNNLKDELGLKNVVFLGNQSHELLRKVYNIADVSAVPSKKEAFGLVALEAIACGTPVVATRQGGLPDFINDKVGILVEKENVQELEDAISKILNNVQEFDTDYLQEYAKNNYRQDLLIDKLINIYQEAIEENKE